jgi:hypothetical protein
MDTPATTLENIHVVDIPIVKVEEDLNTKIDTELSRLNTSQTQNDTGDTGSLEQHLLTNIKKIREKVIIYEYMCYKTSSYYNFWNRVFLVPSIILTSGLALINSNLGQEYASELKIFNVVSNGVLTLLISLQNAFKFGEKGEYFFNQKKKFTKLHNALNNEIINQNNNSEMIMNQINEYEQLDENLLYEFPRNIIVDTRVKFAKYSLPTICNGIKVVEDDIQLRQKRRRKVYSIPAPNEEK